MPNSKQSSDLKKNFHAVYEEFANAIFRYSYSKLSDREKAKDVVQDTFVRFWEYISAGNKVDNPKAFLYKIATNAIIDHYRKRKPDLSLEDLAEDGFDPADMEGFRQQALQVDSQIALDLLNKIQADDKQIILLRYVDGLSVKEIAEVLDERENTISVKIHRAIKELQALFDKHDQ